MFDGSVPWSVGVGGAERSWRALGAPNRLWSDGVFVVAVGVSAEEGGEGPRGGGAWCGCAAGRAFAVFWRAAGGWLCFG